MSNVNDLVGFLRKRVKELEAQVAELTKKKPTPATKDRLCDCASCLAAERMYEYG